MRTITDLWIDGGACASESAQSYPVFNPADLDEHVGDVANGVVADVDRACAAAHRAYPAWSALTYYERADHLIAAAKELVRDKDKLAERITLFTREHGKLKLESEIEMSRIAGRFEEVAAYADRLATDDELRGPPKDTIVTRRPRGVAALIVPWNWPLSILGAKLPQALLAGNTAVIKLSENAPMATAQAVILIAQCFPPGVVNLLTGDSSRIGDPLLRHPLVKYINFTGSVRIGKHVMSVASENLTPVTLELGGNDPGIILEDAVLDDKGMQNLYIGAFLTSGQVCMALKRLYVHRSRFNEVVDGLSTILSTKIVGNELDPDVTFAPVNNERQFKTVNTIIDQAKASDADIRAFGEIKSNGKRGYFIRPTLAIDPDPSLDVVAQEQFGPVLPIIPFDSDEEVVAAANESQFGLCSSVWTEDMGRAVAMARRLEAGFTYINGHGPTVQDGRAPFGGFKNSGIGRNLGYEGVLSFQGYHSISAPADSIFEDKSAT